jgi:hypothetical protein
MGMTRYISRFPRNEAMAKKTFKKSLALSGLLFVSSALVGCGVSPQEVARQTQAAYRKGYGDGERAEQARCAAKIEKIEQEHREEKAELENKILALKTVTVAAVGILGLALLGGSAYGVIRFVRRRRGNHPREPDEWRYRKPPPSVTEER